MKILFDTKDLPKCFTHSETKLSCDSISNTQSSPLRATTTRKLHGSIPVLFSVYAKTRTSFIGFPSFVFPRLYQHRDWKFFCRKATDSRTAYGCAHHRHVGTSWQLFACASRWRVKLAGLSCGFSSVCCKQSSHHHRLAIQQNARLSAWRAS